MENNNDRGHIREASVVLKSRCLALQKASVGFCVITFSDMGVKQKNWIAISH